MSRSIAEEVPPRRMPLKRLIGAAVTVAAIAWLLSRTEFADMWRVVRNSNPMLLLATLPLVLANMAVRALRWRPLLGSAEEAPYWPAFSALMIGYLANLILPARVGDLVRVYVLGNMGKLSRSRILASVVVERILDMAAILVVLGMIAAAFSPIPEWMRKGAVMLAAAALTGTAVLVLIALGGEKAMDRPMKLIAAHSPGFADRLRRWTTEFVGGVRRFRHPHVGIIFAAATAVIWMFEIAIVLLVGLALRLDLSALDGVVLMLSSLFSSLIPALPGQFGAFELAIVTGLEFLGHGGVASLPFALALHFILLASTSGIGLFCLVRSGLPLLPSGLMQRLERGTDRESEREQ